VPQNLRQEIALQYNVYIKMSKTDLLTVARGTDGVAH